MASERSTLWFHIFARGNADKKFRELARAMREAHDAADGLNKAHARGEDNAGRIREQANGLREFAEHARAANAELDKLGRGRNVKVTLPDLHKRADVEVGKAHSLGVRIGAGITMGIAKVADDAPRHIFNALAKAGPQGQAAMAGLMVGLLPTIGAGISGAIIGAAGSGGVIGGLVLASRDQRVKQAGAALGAHVLHDLEARSRHFVPVMLTGIGTVREAWRQMGPDLDRVFRADRFVAPLVGGVTSGVRRLMKGIADAVDNGGPVMQALADMASRIGGAVGDVFSMLATQSFGAAAGLNDVTTAMENFIRATGLMLQYLAAVKGGFEKFDQVLDAGRYNIEKNIGAMFGLADGLDLTADGFKAGSKEAEAYRRITLGTATAADIALVQQAKLQGGLRETGAASGEAAAAQKVLWSRLFDTRTAVERQHDALDELAIEMRAQVDPVYGLYKAQKDLAKAQRDSAKATDEHGAKSAQAREANLRMAVAAVAVQDAVGKLGSTFNGKLTPSMRATLVAAGLTKKEINNVEREFREAKKAGDRFAGKYVAVSDLIGERTVAAQLSTLLSMQRALKQGKNWTKPNESWLRGGLASGGPVPGSSPNDRADNIPAWLTADEWVIRRRSARKMQRDNPGALKYINERGELPPMAGFARGGQVNWPYPVTAKGAWVPSREEAMSKVTPAVPRGGATAPFMERMLERLFGVNMISGFRRGARTLSGRQSYHALNRAVDFPAIKNMAAYMYRNFKPRLKEAITPWQQYNVHNGRSHRYSGAVWRQHNFSGGNAHNHFAMANGGVINEPVFGVGRSGRSYSFAERGPETVVPGRRSNPGKSVTVVNHNTFHIHGSGLSADQIAAAVDRKLGRTVDLYQRGG